MNTEETKRNVDKTWRDDILPTLCRYIRIANKSPDFDPEWQAHGHMERAVRLLEEWCLKQPVRGMNVETVRLEGRTPVLLVEIAGSAEEVVLLYGHYDKQPELDGWSEGLGPWEPVVRDGKLYGRGGADDGYAVFAGLTAIRMLQEQRIPHARCVILIEGSEESGSIDLPFYVDLLQDRIGVPDLVICLDGECGNYEHMWCTTSLRGIVTGTLRVDVLTEGVHSGTAGGIVPSSFRLARRLLSKLEDEATGRIVPAALHVDIPARRREQAQRSADALGDSVYLRFPWLVDAPVRPQAGADILLDNAWRPTMTVTGAGGIPSLTNAGSVLLPQTALKLSVRIPPTCDARAAARNIRHLVEDDEPPNARVRFDIEACMPGWNAPATAGWLETATERSSVRFFGKPAMSMGAGGTIPFMGMLAEKFAEAQFLVTGVLGPHSNAHGPNEFLHLETGKRLTACIAEIIAAHFRQS